MSEARKELQIRETKIREKEEEKIVDWQVRKLNSSKQGQVTFNFK